MPSDFERFSATHAIVVAVGAVVVAGLVLLGRAAARRSDTAERRLRLAWAAAVVAFQGFTQVRVNLPGRFDLPTSLPLHICDLVPWVGVVALSTGRSWPRALAYFWGLGLSGWAFILPVLTHGPAHPEFWLFWIGHVQIIGTAVYLVGVRGFRPDWGCLRVAAIATAVYAAAILPLDIAWGADYGYLGRRSAAAMLGPWPARTAALLGGEILIFVLLLLPWRRSGGNGAREDPAGPPSSKFGSR